MRKASLEELTQVNDIGQVSANCIREFFDNEKNQRSRYTKHKRVPASLLFVSVLIPKHPCEFIYGVAIVCKV